MAGPVPELPAPARNPLQPFSRNTMSHQQPDAEPKGYEQGYVDGFEAGKAATMEAVAPVQEVVHGSPPLAHQQQPLNTSQGSRPARSRAPSPPSVAGRYFSSPAHLRGLSARQLATDLSSVSVSGGQRPSLPGRRAASPATFSTAAAGSGAQKALHLSATRQPAAGVAGTGVTNMTGRGVAASAGPLPSYLYAAV